MRGGGRSPLATRQRGPYHAQMASIWEPARAVVVATAFAGWLSLSSSACSVLVDSNGLAGREASDGGPASALDAGEEAPDAEPTVEGDAGCAVKTMGPLPARAVSSDGKGACNWMAIPGATTRDDGLVAYCELKGILQVTSELLVAGFGFTLPESARVQGVRAEILRSAQAPLATDLRDNDVRLAFGTERSPDRTSSATWPKVFQSAGYGSGTDTWGAALSPAIVNGAGFGVAIKVESQGLDIARAKVDGVDLTVFYCD